LCGAFGRQVSINRALLFGVPILLATFAGLIGWISIVAGNVGAIATYLYPASLAAIVVAASYFILARLRGLSEITDSAWTFLSCSGRS
jgi:hypothetical protein